MALVGHHIFIQPVALERKLDTTTDAIDKLKGTGGLDNTCVAQLMAAPDHHPSDSLVWLTDPGSVIAFTTQRDLTARDVELAWRFALKVDPGDHDNEADFLANFTAEKYQRYVRVCDVRDDTMRRVEISDSGELIIDDEGW